MPTSTNSPAAAGFEARVRSLPVPAPLLGSLLAEIDDMAELKSTLRFLWHAAQVKGSPKAVPTAIQGITRIRMRRPSMARASRPIIQNVLSRLTKTSTGTSCSKGKR